MLPGLMALPKVSFVILWPSFYWHENGIFN